MPDHSDFQTIRQRVLFRDGVLGLRVDDVQGPSGGAFQRKVVEYRKASAIVPVIPDGRVLLIKQYRYPIAKELWDIPGGMVEADEDAETCAVRELAEETGYATERIRFLLRYHPEPALSDHEITLFVGYNAKSTVRSSLVTESEIRAVGLFTQAELRNMVHTGAISSSWTVIGLLLLFDMGLSVT